MNEGTMKVPISEIKIGGERFRKDFGNLDELAANIEEFGLLQAIGVTEDNELVFGERRLRACRDVLGWDEIEAKVIAIDRIIDGEYHENTMRKGFAKTERVAIMKAMRERIGNRQGQRTDKHVQDFAQVEPGKKTRDKLAEIGGFGNPETGRQAEKVFDRGVPGLVEAWEKDEVSTADAAKIAGLPEDVQEELMEHPSPKEAKMMAKMFDEPTKAKNGKVYVKKGKAQKAHEIKLSDRYTDVGGAMRTIAELGVSAQQFVGEMEYYHEDHAMEFFDTAFSWLNEVNDLWGAKQ
jgi:hypothetical protein